LTWRVQRDGPVILNTSDSSLDSSNNLRARSVLTRANSTKEGWPRGTPMTAWHVFPQSGCSRFHQEVLVAVVAVVVVALSLLVSSFGNAWRSSQTVNPESKKRRSGSNDRKGIMSVSNVLGRGWFYWSLKMEGGAFIEWDFLRGVREGWFRKK
jgi:hypothetical protein